MFNKRNYDDNDKKIYDYTDENETGKRIKRLVKVPQPRALNSFIKSLKTFTGIGKDVDVVSTSLKNVDSGIRSLDDALKDMPVTKTNAGHLTIADEPIGSVNKILREGDLSELVRLSGKQIPVTSIDRVNFKQAVSEFPEKTYRDIVDSADVTKTNYPQLNVNVDNLNLLPDSAKQLASKVESNLFKYFKVGTVVVLTVGGITATSIWLERETQNRKGCWMLRTVNGKTSSCKVVDYSCNGNVTMACGVNNGYYNITLSLMKICTYDDTNVDKKAISDLTGVPVADMNARISTLIDQHFEKITNYINGMSVKPTVDVCKITHPDIENGEIPDCRLCVPSANPTSTQYIDPSQYADNITFQCISKPTVIDTISDIAVSTGKNLWDGISNSLGGILKPILIAVGVILVLIVIISILTRVMPKKKEDGGISASTSTQDLLYRSESTYSLNNNNNNDSIDVGV